MRMHKEDAVTEKPAPPPPPAFSSIPPGSAAFLYDHGFHVYWSNPTLCSNALEAFVMISFRDNPAITKAAVVQNDGTACFVKRR